VQEREAQHGALNEPQAPKRKADAARAKRTTLRHKAGGSAERPWAGNWGSDLGATLGERAAALPGPPSLKRFLG